MRGALQDEGENVDTGNAADDVPDPSTATDEVQSLLPVGVPDAAVDVAFALFIAVVGWYLSKYVVRLAGRTVARRIERPSVTRTVLRGVRISVLVLTGLVILNVLGLGGGQIFLQVTIISAVIAVVLAPLVGSLINGFFVLADRPYEIGDMIEVADEGHRGFVEDITIRYTKIFTLQNTFIVIPNSAIQERDVINYSAEDERTRISVAFEITYESDLEVARQQAERATRSVDLVISGGPDIRIGSARYAAAPSCVVNEYADDGIALEVYFWIKHPYKQAIARSDVQLAIRERFADHGIEFAYPHRHHVFDEHSGAVRMDAAESDAPPRDVDPALESARRSDGRGDEGGAEANADADSGAEADAVSDPNADSDAGIDANADTDSDSDADTDRDGRNE